jgi:hypothetical protein
VSAPIRFRLTAWYVVVLAVVIAALGTFVVTQLRSDLVAGVDRSLREGAVQIASGYEAEGAKDFLDVAHTVLPGPTGHGSGAQILSGGGVVSLSVGDPVLRSPLLSGPSLTHAAAGQAVVFSVRSGPSGEHFRAIATPVRYRAKREVLVVAESLATVDRAVHRVLVLLLLGGAGALAVIALGG